eukprot:GFYU01002145.1.p1 GENE.GFYU01002145.1~~GFYU01002145.1.p1  ORF type:complete len:189 (-),score=40.70 GFYU01002145.1:245-811(-)
MQLVAPLPVFSFDHVLHSPPSPLRRAHSLGVPSEFWNVSLPLLLEDAQKNKSKDDSTCDGFGKAELTSKVDTTAWAHPAPVADQKVEDKMPEAPEEAKPAATPAKLQMRKKMNLTVDVSLAGDFDSILWGRSFKAKAGTWRRKVASLDFEEKFPLSAKTAKALEQDTRMNTVVDSVVDDFFGDTPFTV